MTNETAGYEDIKAEALTKRQELITIIRNEFGNSLDKQIEEFVDATEKNIKALDAYKKAAESLTGGTAGQFQDSNILMNTMRYIHGVIIGKVNDLQSSLEDMPKDLPEQQIEFMKNAVRSLTASGLDMSTAMLNDTTNISSRLAFATAEKNTTIPSIKGRFN